MTTSVTFYEDARQGVVEDDGRVTEGETRSYVCTYWTDVTGTPTATAFRSSMKTGKGTSVTSTVFPSGSVAVSGRNVTLKPATGFVGPALYIINVTSTIGTETRVNFFVLDVKRDEDAP